MKNKDFVNSIIRLYQQADRLTEGFHDDTIIRGRRHTISSMVEDALASFIRQHLPDQNLRLWIDYPLSYKPAGAARMKTIYPDIAIVRPHGDTFLILAIIDVKMDLGWKRNYWEQLPKVAAGVAQLREVEWAKRRVPGINGWKDDQWVKISSQLKLKLAVMSDQNISATAFEKNRKALEEHPSELQLYAFTTGPYLGYATPENIEVRDNEINQFVADLLHDINLA